MTDKRKTPDLGATYVDSEGRVLTVDEVDLSNPLDRHVRGYLNGDLNRRFSCTITQWAYYWRDGNPPTPPAEQTGA